MPRYKQAKYVKCHTGDGLTKDDIRFRTTLEEKLNRLCPYFEQMHAVFGGRPNVAPPMKADVRVEDGDYIVNSESGEADMDEDCDQLHVEPSEPYTPTVVLDGTPTSQALHLSTLRIRPHQPLCKGVLLANSFGMTWRV